jgi:hypothetical protein
MEQEELDSHIAASRELLNYVGGRGFPTFVCNGAIRWKCWTPAAGWGSLSSGRSTCVMKPAPCQRRRRTQRLNAICTAAAATEEVCSDRQA